MLTAGRQAEIELARKEGNQAQLHKLPFKGDESKHVPLQNKTKPLDEATASTILKEAGGDKNRARQIAKERGYKF